MMQLSELYDKTKLPVDEKLLNNLLNKYLEISYAKMSNLGREMYQKLYSQINISSESATSFNQSDLDNFIALIQQDYIKAGRPYDPKKYNGINNPLDLMPGWAVFQSWNLLGTDKIEEKNIEHRFYFGISNEKTYELARVLYEKLKYKGIPFYFKTEISPQIERRDNLVLYTSTPLLEKTLQVIEELQKERPDLLKHCYEPSILVGKFSEKIGYATEVVNKKNSYTSLVCKIFLTALDNCIKQYGNFNIEIMSLYQQKITEYKQLKKDISSEDVKRRILVDILVKNYPTFKQKLFNQLKSELIKEGLNIDNICCNSIYRNYLSSEQITSQNTNLPDLEKKSLEAIRKEYIEDSILSSQSNKAVELQQAKEELIRQYEDDYVDEDSTNYDGTLSDKMTLLTQRKGIHR